LISWGSSSGVEGGHDARPPEQSHAVAQGDGGALASPDVAADHQGTVLFGYPLGRVGGPIGDHDDLDDHSIDLTGDIVHHRGQGRFLVEGRDDHGQLPAHRIGFLVPVIPHEVPTGQPVSVLAEQVLQAVGLGVRPEDQDVGEDARDQEEADGPPGVSGWEPENPEDGVHHGRDHGDNAQPQGEDGHDRGVGEPEAAATPPYRGAGQHGDRHDQADDAQVDHDVLPGGRT
jgi:hypothetical protein